MSTAPTAPTVPYRLEFSVEVPGSPEQVWDAVATAKGMSAWFGPTELEEREGGALRFVMGPDMDSHGQVTGWDPPRRLVYQEDWAALMGKDPDSLSPLTSEFVVEATSGGTCVVRVTSSGFGVGADWEQEWWDDMGVQWRPFFDNLRLYLAHFPGQEATELDVVASHPGDADTLWAALRAAAGLGEEGSPFELRGTTGTVERLGAAHQAVVRVTAPVPGIVNLYTYGYGEDGVDDAAGEGGRRAVAGLRAFLFSADAAAYARREEQGWREWLEGVTSS